MGEYVPGMFLFQVIQDGVPHTAHWHRAPLRADTAVVLVFSFLLLYIVCFIPSRRFVCLCVFVLQPFFLLGPGFEGNVRWRIYFEDIVIISPVLHVFNACGR